MAKIKKPNTGYLTLVTQKFAEENGINFVYVLSQREIDNFSRMKGSLDPITMAKKLGGSIGTQFNATHSGTSNAQHITEHKVGKKKITSASKNPGINPLYTKISSVSVTPVRKNDSIADILSKMYNYIKLNHDQEIKRKELQHNFKKGALDDSNLEFLKLLKSAKSYSSADDKKGPSGDNILGNMLDSLLSTVESVIAGLAAAAIALKAIKPPAEKLSKQNKSKSATEKVPPEKIHAKEKSKKTVGLVPKTGTEKVDNLKTDDAAKLRAKDIDERAKKLQAEPETPGKPAAQEYHARTPTPESTATKVTEVPPEPPKTASKVSGAAGKVMRGANIAAIAVYIYQTWEEVSALDPKDFPSKDAYHKKVASLIGKAFVDYGFVAVVSIIGGALGGLIGGKNIKGKVLGVIVGLASGFAAGVWISEERQKEYIEKLTDLVVDFFWDMATSTEISSPKEKDFIMKDLKGPNNEQSTLNDDLLGYSGQDQQFHAYSDDEIKQSRNRYKDTISAEAATRGEPNAAGSGDKSIAGSISDKFNDIINSKSLTQLKLEKGGQLANLIDEYLSAKSTPTGKNTSSSTTIDATSKSAPINNEAPATTGGTRHDVMGPYISSGLDRVTG